MVLKSRWLSYYKATKAVGSSVPVLVVKWNMWAIIVI